MRSAETRSASNWVAAIWDVGHFFQGMALFALSRIRDKPSSRRGEPNEFWTASPSLEALGALVGEKSERRRGSREPLTLLQGIG